MNKPRSDDSPKIKFDDTVIKKIETRIFKEETVKQEQQKQLKL